jgi:hypothetical protein
MAEHVFVETNWVVEHVFPLDEDMLAESVRIATSTDVVLESFDMAILAAVLVAAKRLTGETISFCTLDTNLKCWGKNSGPKPELRALYDAARVWIYGDFLRSTPARPTPWP